MRKFIAAGFAALSIFGGTVACDDQSSDNGQYAEVEYGYYNGPSFIYYPSPRVIYVSHSYYIKNSRLFANPYHHSIPDGVRVDSVRVSSTTHVTHITNTVHITHTTHVTIRKH